ncbi:TauD/TfdA dioxygenase family protein [Actinomycetospora sp. CA-101289]|uniref:TauD/TfdA dioxygenase family protein n=1 Tax=Actinomycetospora sp. CA-101289 TaxID=3239893 RepID=UPI003D9978F1
MHTRPLSPLGVEVTDVDLTALDDEQVEAFRVLLAEHGVVVVPGQDGLDDDGFAAFLRRFGDVVFTVGETPVPGRDDLNVVSNVRRTTPPRSVFHTDTSYVARPPAYTALRAVQIPSRGGETLFTDQYRAYETLPADIRAHLAGRTITHEVSGLRPEDAGPETSAEHPVFRRHPVSGRTSLYLSTPERCVAMSGMDRGAARTTIGYLYEHSTAEDNTFRHAWSPGDVVVWDNGCVLHRADHADVTGDRVMHRGMVAAS